MTERRNDVERIVIKETPRREVEGKTKPETIVARHEVVPQEKATDETIKVRQSAVERRDTLDRIDGRQEVRT